MHAPPLRNILWLLITAALLSAVIYNHPHPRTGQSAMQLLSAPDSALTPPTPSNQVNPNQRITIVYNAAATLTHLDGRAQELKMAHLADILHNRFHLYHSGLHDDNGTIAHFNTKLIIRAPLPTQRKIAAYLTYQQPW